MPKHILESVKEAPVRRGSRWLVTIAVPGQGSSGVYSPEVLREYGPSAFPDGTRAYWGHTTPDKRDPRDLLGKYEGTFWSEEEQKLKSYLVAKPHWNPVIESLGEDLELSIYTTGEKDEDDNVTALYNTRTTSVDAVAYGGLQGSGLNEQIETLVESARLAEETDDDTDEKPGANVAQENGSTMELEAKVDNLVAAVSALTDLVTGSKQAEAQAAADAAAVEAAATEAREGYAAAVEAIEAARGELLEPQVKALFEAAKRGEDVASKIVESLELAKSLKQSVEEEAQAGRVLGEGFKVESALDLGKVFG